MQVSPQVSPPPEASCGQVSPPSHCLALVSFLSQNLSPAITDVPVHLFNIHEASGLALRTARFPAPSTEPGTEVVQ